MCAVAGAGGLNGPGLAQENTSGAVGRDYNQFPLESKAEHLPVRPDGRGGFNSATSRRMSVVQSSRTDKCFGSNSMSRVHCKTTAPPSLEIFAEDAEWRSTERIMSSARPGGPLRRSPSNLWSCSPLLLVSPKYLSIATGGAAA